MNFQRSVPLNLGRGKRVSKLSALIYISGNGSHPGKLAVVDLQTSRSQYESIIESIRPGRTNLSNQLGPGLFTLVAITTLTAFPSSWRCKGVCRVTLLTAAAVVDQPQGRPPGKTPINRLNSDLGESHILTTKNANFM